MPSLPALSTCKICGFDESVHLRPCTAADIVVAAVTTPIVTTSSALPSTTALDTTVTDTDTAPHHTATTTMADDNANADATATPTSPTFAKAKSQSYEGQCHCGKVKFSVKLNPPVEEGVVTSCNCSICTANGYLMVYPLEKHVTWHQGFDDLTTYTFGKERIDHSFCSVCGTSVCAMSNDPGFFQDNRAINVRTLQGVDLEKLKLRKADGRNM